MGYENAPATILLATHCAACGRDLVDAVSVNSGMGPECRKKYMGKKVDASEEARSAANKLVYQIAVLRSGLEKGTPEPNAALKILELAQAVRVLGFLTLAEILEDRTSTIQIMQVDSVYLVRTPYTEVAVNLFRTIPGREWVKAEKANKIPISSRENLWGVLRKCFKGAVAVGPKGPFVIGG